MTAAETIRTVRALNGLTRTQLAHMADVSPSTVTRIEAGQLDPTYSMWEKLLNAAGYRAGVTIESVADICAVAAAREMLTGASFELPETGPWRERWQRAGLSGARFVPEIALQAAAASPLRSRPGMRTATYDRSWQQIVRDFRANHVQYAMSGLNAAEGGDRWSGSTSPVIYVENVSKAFEVASLTTPSPGEQVLTILPFDEVSRRGVWRDAADFSWVDRIQALIDSYGGPGRMADNADAIAERIGRELAA
ncbi:helix-turn-helix domain-containing protein [Subtercola endophyticus]|uniref:helix-turn-helix domain-containing protein n=1 Tax=Subtercola endophyticus TaxID=2895559 RepID=UPI002105D7E0|nr:helix-turn-helix transcriptional regulator [Subtercola endophyticus]